MTKTSKAPSKTGRIRILFNNGIPAEEIAKRTGSTVQYINAIIALDVARKKPVAPVALSPDRNLEAMIAQWNTEPAAAPAPAEPAEPVKVTKQKVYTAYKRARSHILDSEVPNLFHQTVEFADRTEQSWVFKYTSPVTNTTRSVTIGDKRYMRHVSAQKVVESYNERLAAGIDPFPPGPMKKNRGHVTHKPLPPLNALQGVKVIAPPPAMTAPITKDAEDARAGERAGTTISADPLAVRPEPKKYKPRKPAEPVGIVAKFKAKLIGWLS